MQHPRELADHLPPRVSMAPDDPLEGAARRYGFGWKLLVHPLDELIEAKPRSHCACPALIGDRSQKSLNEFAVLCRIKTEGACDDRLRVLSMRMARVLLPTREVRGICYRGRDATGNE